jgi:hypothetical protein
MATPTGGAVPAARSELRTRTALVLEAIALRHQIAVLERSRTRRPCFCRFDRLFWILLSRWWPQWRESLMIVQAETVLRWRRNGWSAIWGYRSRGLCRWRDDQALTPTARRVPLRPGRRARGAMYRSERLDTAPGRSWKTRGNHLPTAVPMRSPPYETRASPKAAVARESGSYSSRSSVLISHTYRLCYPWRPRRFSSAPAFRKRPARCTTRRFRSQHSRSPS